jgi:hypothetical protein
MHDIFSREPDPLEGMLRPPSPPDNEALRQELYPRTQRVLRRRRHLRQLAYAAALLISFGAGGGTVRLMVEGERGALAPRSSEQSRESKQTNTQPNQQQGADAPRSPVSCDSALTREWTAFDSEDHRSERYRQAADYYLTEENDPESALRCYSNALDSGTEQDLTISADDSYLLMAIKNARQKERNHAKQGG